MILSLLSLWSSSSPQDTISKEFAEKFRYLIISSQLLDSSLSPSNSLPDIARFSTPNLTPLPIHSAATPSSAQTSHFSSSSSSSTECDRHLSDRQQQDAIVKKKKNPEISTTTLFSNSILQKWIPKSNSLDTHISSIISSSHWNIIIISLCLFFAINGYYTCAVLVTPCLRRRPTGGVVDQVPEDDGSLQARKRTNYQATLDALHNLVLANDAWSSIVNETMNAVESEERQ